MKTFEQYQKTAPKVVKRWLKHADSAKVKGDRLSARWWQKMANDYARKMDVEVT